MQAFLPCHSPIPRLPANSLTPFIALSSDRIRATSLDDGFFFDLSSHSRSPPLRPSPPPPFRCPSNLSPPHKTRFSTALTGWHTGSPLLFPYFASLAAFSNAGVALSCPACCFLGPVLFSVSLGLSFPSHFLHLALAQSYFPLLTSFSVSRDTSSSFCFSCTSFLALFFLPSPNTDDFGASFNAVFHRTLSPPLQHRLISPHRQPLPVLVHTGLATSPVPTRRLDDNSDCFASNDFLTASTILTIPSISTSTSTTTPTTAVTDPSLPTSTR